MLRRGQLYWARLPGDPKRRPVLLASPDVRNRLGATVLVIPATTVKRIGPWHVSLRKGEGGLTRASVLRCENVTTIDKSLLDEGPLGGPLSGARMAEVGTCLIIAN